MCDVCHDLTKKVDEVTIRVTKHVEARTRRGKGVKVQVDAKTREVKAFPMEVCDGCVTEILSQVGYLIHGLRRGTKTLRPELLEEVTEEITEAAWEDEEVPREDSEVAGMS